VSRIGGDDVTKEDTRKSDSVGGVFGGIHCLYHREKLTMVCVEEARDRYSFLECRIISAVSQLL